MRPIRGSLASLVLVLSAAAVASGRPDLVFRETLHAAWCLPTLAFALLAGVALGLPADSRKRRAALRAAGGVLLVVGALALAIATAGGSEFGPVVLLVVLGLVAVEAAAAAGAVVLLDGWPERRVRLVLASVALVLIGAVAFLNLPQRRLHALEELCAVAAERAHSGCFHAAGRARDRGDLALASRLYDLACAATAPPDISRDAASRFQSLSRTACLHLGQVRAEIATRRSP